MYLALDITLLTAISADLIGNLTFLRSYFTLGIPIYSTRVYCDAPRAPGALARDLTDRMRSGLLRSLVFRRLSNSEVGFRESYFDWGLYAPVMHGVVEFSQANDAIVITGRLNWGPLALIAVFLSRALDQPLGSAVPKIGILLLGIAICFALQASQYRAIARAIPEQARAGPKADPRH